MAKIISANYLNKKLTCDQLRSKVGSVRINSDNSSRALGGIGLKKFITKLGGKTETQIEKILKDKYGVSGYQVKKRESIMKLIRGDEKSGLDEEQIKRNLKRNMQRDEPLTREVSKTPFAGKVVSTRSIGIFEAQKYKDSIDSISAKRLGIGVNNTIEFGGEQPNKPVISSINPKN